MSSRDLDAAGIGDPRVRASYERCRRLFAQHGKSYYLATQLLPAPARPHVWALYGFARYADDMVDQLGPTGEVPGDAAMEAEARADRFGRWSAQVMTALGTGQVGDPVTLALLSTMRRHQIPRTHVEAFLEAMRQDLTVTTYATYADLERYMYGSAAVIGLQMLPVLRPLAPEATVHARALGEAFQLTNFIRDVGEDLDRGRIYLPQEDLAAFGVTPQVLRARTVTPAVRELLRFQIERARRLYTFAEPGITMLHPTSRPCVRAAFDLYRGILDAVEDAHYQVLSSRVRVSLTTRASVALPGWRAARAARRDESRWVEA